MKFTTFYSTDGKHTVQVEFDETESAEAQRQGQEIYDRIVGKYGTKQEQAVKAYAKKPAFPDDSGPRATEGSDGVEFCPVHHKPFREGQYGWYCPTKVGEGWCKEKPRK